MNGALKQYGLLETKNDQTQIKLTIHLTKKNGDIITADMKGLYHPWIE
jgi:hypothetical protein